MLEQEGLVDITHSSSSEQIAYLLVERSTLLEKLEALEQKVESYGCLSSLCASQFQVYTTNFQAKLDVLLPQMPTLLMPALSSPG